MVRFDAYGITLDHSVELRDSSGGTVSSNAVFPTLEAQDASRPGLSDVGNRTIGANLLQHAPAGGVRTPGRGHAGVFGAVAGGQSFSSPGGSFPRSGARWFAVTPRSSILPATTHSQLILRIGA